MAKVFFAFLVLYFVKFSEAGKGCDLNTLTLGTSEPLFLVKDATIEYAGVVYHDENSYRFKIPEDGILKFKDGEKFTIACTTLRHAAGTLENGQCKNGQFVRDNGRAYDGLTTYQCNQPNQIAAKYFTTPCSQGRGRQYVVGFILQDNTFVELYETCHDTLVHSTMYTSHTLHGPSIKNHHSGPRSNTFYTYALAGNVRDFYTVASQNDLLQQVNGETAQQTQLYLARGHLLPYSDMVFRSWQRATNTYLNVVPEWQIINNGNWVKMEMKVQEKAAKLKKNLKIVTGGIGPLSMDGTEMKLNPNNKIFVPAYMYKLVMDLESKQGIAFVVMNNPQARVNEFLCTDICTLCGWSFPTRNDGTQGFLTCCSIDEFKRKIAYPPNSIENVETAMSF